MENLVYMTESFYDILGVSKKASAEEIKRSYRKLSLKYHPDKTKDVEFIEKYKKINEAYGVLGDEGKRREYDMMNDNPFFKMAAGGGDFPFGPGSFHHGGEGGDINDIFSHLFGSMGGGPPSGVFGIRTAGGCGPQIHIVRGGQGPNGFPFAFETAMEKPIPIIKNIDIRMAHVATGVNLPVEIDRWVLEEGTKVFEKETIYVKIPKGIDDNEIIVLREKGNVISDQNKGDIKIIIRVVNDTEFKRHGLDLVWEKTISLKEALCGFTFELKYINGKTYTINNNAGNIIYPEYKKVIPKMGITRENDVGNLVIVFHVQFPDTLTQEQMNSIAGVLSSSGV